MELLALAALLAAGLESGQATSPGIPNIKFTDTRLETDCARLFRHPATDAVYCTGRMRIAWPPPGAIFTCSRVAALTCLSSRSTCFGFCAASGASE